MSLVVVKLVGESVKTWLNSYFKRITFRQFKVLRDS